jgi:transposase
MTDPKAFKTGREFAAWIGLVPRQNSTGGEERLGSISKQGDRYLRRLFVLGAISCQDARMRPDKYPWVIETAGSSAGQGGCGWRIRASGHEHRANRPDT